MLFLCDCCKDNRITAQAIGRHGDCHFLHFCEFLQILEKKGISKGIVTSARKIRLNSMFSKCFLDRFETVVTAESTERGKPHPDPYLDYLIKSKSKIDCTIVIENAPLGIQSAKAAGIYCVAITNTLPSEYLINAEI